MPDLPISGLPASTTPLTGAELCAIVQGGVTRQVAINELGLQFVVDEQGSSPYPDIQDAIDAAETRGVPASILVLDGDYTGFNLVGDRISIQGLSSLSQGVKITGNVTVTATSVVKQFVLSQMFINGTLTLAGTSQLLLFMDHVEINQSGGSSPLVMTNTNAGSTLIAQNLTASELSNTAPALDRSAGAMNLDCHDCEFSRNGAGNSAFVAMDYSAGGGGIALLRNCKVLGQIDLSTSSLSMTMSGAAGQVVTAGTTASLKLTGHTGVAFVLGVNLAIIGGGDVVDPNPSASFLFSNVVAGFGTLIDTGMGTRIDVDGVALQSDGLVTEFLNATGGYSVPGAAAGGADRQVQFNNAGVLDGNSNLILTASGTIGMAVAVPDTRLHVSGNGMAGSVAAASGTVITIENNGDSYLSILGPDADEKGIFFGEPASNIAGSILYNRTGTLDGIQFGTNAVAGRMVLDSAGALGLGTLAPDASAIVDLVSTTRGLLQPRVTTVQRDAISTPADGLSVHNSDRDRPEFFDAAAWQQLSVVSTVAVEIFTVSDLDALATAGVITIPTGTQLAIILKSDSITTAVRFALEGTGRLRIVSDLPGSTIIYNGTGTFVSGNTDLVAFTNIILVSISTGTMASLTGGFFNITNCVITGFDDLGTISGSSGLIMRDSALFDIDSGFGVDQSDINFVNNLIESPGLIGNFVDVTDAARDTSYTISGNAVTIGAGAFFRFDPGLTAGSRLSFSTNTLGAIPIFDTTGGTTGTFTAVADAAVALTTIDSVTDSSGVARFNFTVGPTLFVDQEVDIVNFVTQTTYNQKGIITAVGAGFFEIASIAFVADDATGDFSSDSVTLTDAVTSLNNGDTLLISTDDATDYDGGATVYNQLTNSFQINRAFTVTKAGTWDTAGIDQKDPRVISTSNPNAADSKYVCAGFVNNNATVNGTIVNNTFTDMVFGTAGTALIAAKTIERFKLIDELNGTFEYTGNEPFEGRISFDFTVTSSGGAVDFRFKFVKDVGAGFVNLDDNVEALVDVGSTAASITKTIPLCLNKGDLFKPQITRNSGSSGITTSYATLYATQ